jgi:hypothetical protein
VLRLLAEIAQAHVFDHAAAQRRGARVVVENLARRFFRLAFEEIALVEAIERGLDDARVLPGLD